MNIQPKKTSIWASFGTMFSKMNPALFIFGGVQSIPAFEREFGNPTSPDGSYEISPSRASFMSSIGFAGRLGSTFIGLLDHRRGIWIICVISWFRAVLTLLIISLDPFAQQLIQLRSNLTDETSASALIAQSSSYTMGTALINTMVKYTIVNSTTTYTYTVNPELPLSMQMAVLIGLLSRTPGKLSRR
ncbi:hypothetical protein VTI74DRAFT_10670 [Chaetomium olivicolor]